MLLQTRQKAMRSRTGHPQFTGGVTDPEDITLLQEAQKYQCIPHRR